VGRRLLTAWHQLEVDGVVGATGVVLVIHVHDVLVVLEDRQETSLTSVGSLVEAPARNVANLRVGGFGIELQVEARRIIGGTENAVLLNGKLGVGGFTVEEGTHILGLGFVAAVVRVGAMLFVCSSASRL